MRRCLAALALGAGTLALAGCQPGAASDGASPAGRFPQAVKGLGTEPFWSIEMRGAQFAWSDMAVPEPRRIIVSRQENAGALIVTGRLDGQSLRGEFRETPCSDGMSDRRYPFTLSLVIGQARFSGCAYPEGMRFPAQ